jgi:F-box protein 9
VSSLSTGTAKGQAHQTDEESVELQRFRQEWLEELHKRKAVNPEAFTADTFLPGSATPDHGRGRLKSPDSASHPAVRNGKIDGEVCMPPVLRKALDIYRRAIEQEQAGDFDEALLLYRQAFRLVRRLHLFRNIHI